MEGWDPVNRYNHSLCLAVDTPTDRPKSVLNRYMQLKFLVASLCCLSYFFSDDIGAFVIWLSQISSFFSKLRKPWRDILVTTYNLFVIA